MGQMRPRHEQHSYDLLCCYECTAAASSLCTGELSDGRINKKSTRDRAVAARLAHNQEVAGSNPAPATEDHDREKLEDEGK